MLKFFKHNNVGQVIIIVATVAILCGRAYIGMPGTTPRTDVFSPLYDLLFGWTARLPHLALAVAMILIIAEGLWLNLLLFYNKIIPPGSLLPLLLYIVAMCWNTEYLTMSPVLMVNLMLIAAMSQLLTDGSTTLSVERNFNTSFFIGTAILFYLPSYCLILFLIFVLVAYKTYTWRHFAATLLGLAGPLLLMLTYSFLTDKATYYAFLFSHDISNAAINTTQVGFYNTARNILFIALLVIASFAQVGRASDSTIHQRINNWIMVLPLSSGAAMLFYTNIFPPDPQLLAVSFSFSSTAILLTDRKKKWINESLFILILAFCIIK